MMRRINLVVCANVKQHDHFATIGGTLFDRKRNYSGQEEILATNFTNGANFLRIIRAIRGKGWVVTRKHNPAIVATATRA